MERRSFISRCTGAGTGMKVSWDGWHVPLPIMLFFRSAALLGRLALASLVRTVFRCMGARSPSVSVQSFARGSCGSPLRSQPRRSADRHHPSTFGLRMVETASGSGITNQAHLPQLIGPTPNADAATFRCRASMPNSRSADSSPIRARHTEKVCLENGRKT
jgi:hypothetical protein